MTHRLISDDTGRPWQVWETRPGPRSKVAPQLEGGWLTFEALTQVPEKRRLAPVPPGWALLPDRDLLPMLARAEPVAARARTTAAVLEEASAPPPPPPPQA